MNKQITIILFILFITVLSFGQTMPEELSELEEPLMENDYFVGKSAQNNLLVKQQLDREELIRFGDETATGMNEFIYDDNYNLSFYLILGRNEGATNWHNSQRRAYKYNESNNLSEDVKSEWNEDLNEWVYSEKRIIEYDEGSSMRTTYTIQDWDEMSGDWVNKGLYQYFYVGDVQSEDTIFSWNTDSDVWELSASRLRNYDEEGHDLGYVYRVWDYGEWVNYSRYVYEYDSSGNRISKKKYRWNNISGLWNNYYEYTYDYDENGNGTQYLYRRWDDDVNSWLNYSKKDFFYSDLYTTDELILPYWFSSVTMRTGYSYYRWSSDLSDWEERYTATAFYSTQEILEISEPISFDKNVFPNPSSDVITFEIPTWEGEMQLEIINTNGKKMLSRKIRSSEEVSIENFPSGIYFYKLKTEEEELSGKLVRE